jgi:hypothetical protein
MRPVTLSSVEGRNFIFGTFDTTGFQTWWKSLPFPGNIESIEDITHVYGQYHVCIVKMQDGTYSIYRTHDSGKTWISVYNTSDIIYSITKIDYGWVIASTSSGWIESVLDSGLTWETISNFAPGCKTVINIGDNILFAHDGNFVWKSIDLARTWSKVLDVHNLSIRIIGHDRYEILNKRWTGYCPPALDGFEGRIIVGCGPYIAISDDKYATSDTTFDEIGTMWYGPGSWYTSGDKRIDRTDRVMSFLSPYSDRKILQVALTNITGYHPGKCLFVVRLHMIQENIVRYLKCAGPYASNLHFDILFDLQYKGDNIGNISTYQVNRLGTSEEYLLSTISSYDSNNHPILECSIDGGNNWNRIDTRDITVYEGNPEQEIISGLGQYVFNENYLGPRIWSSPLCHNKKDWIVSYFNRMVQGVSWDVDVLTTFEKKAILDSIINTVKVNNKEYISDISTKKYSYKNYNSYMSLKNTDIKNMIISGCIKTTFEKPLNNIDIINAAKINKSTDFNILSLKRIDSVFNMRMNQKDAVEKSCGFVIKLVDDHVDEIMTSINRYTLQAPDIRYPSIPYVPFDSRNQEVT